MRWRRHAGGDGDHAGALEMEIKAQEKAIPCHKLTYM